MGPFHPERPGDQGRAADRQSGEVRLSTICPACKSPIANGFFCCQCAMDQETVDLVVPGHDGRAGALHELKSALEVEVKAKEEELGRTRKHIDDLHGRALELRTTSGAWLKAFHDYQFGTYEPKAATKGPPCVPGGEKSCEPEGPEQRPGFLERIAIGILVVIGIFILASLVLVVLLIVWPIVLLVLVIAAIVLLYIYGNMAIRYKRWLSANIRRTREEKEALEFQASKLALEVERLRIRYASEQEQIRALKARVKEVTAKVEAEEKAQADAAETPGKHRGISGLLWAAANVIPVGKCPKCEGSFVAEPDGEEVLDENYRLLADAVGGVFQGEPKVEVATTTAKKSRCRWCGHKWQQVSTETKTLNGACPSCYGVSTALPEGEEALATRYNLVGGGEGKDFFRGRTEVKVETDVLKKMSCRKCGHGWGQKSTRRDSLHGVCPECHEHRKVLILEEEVESKEWNEIVSKNTVIIDKNYDPIGQSLHQEQIRKRKVWVEKTYKCRSCSHEWTEEHSETFRV